MIHAANILKSREFWRSQKPPLGAQIDLGNTFACGLVRCFLINEKEPGVIRDLARTRNATISAGGYVDESRGVAYSIAASQAGATGYQADLPSGSTPLTLFAVAKCAELAFSKYAGVITIGNSTSYPAHAGNSAQLGFGNDTNYGKGSNLRGIGVTQYGDCLGAIDGVNYSASVYYATSCSIIGTNYYLVLNGKYQGTKSMTTNRVVSSESLYINSAPWTLNDGATKTVCGFIWARSLTIAEQSELHSNPYQFLYVPTPRTWFVAAGGGTPLTLDISDSVTLSDDRAFSVGIGKSDSFTIDDARSNDCSVPKSDSFSVSDSRSNDFGSAITDAFTANDNTSRSYGVAKSDSVSFSDSIETLIGLIISVIDTITASDSEVLDFSKGIIDTVAISDLVAKETSKALADSFTVSDSAINALNGILTEWIINLLSQSRNGVAQSTAFTVTRTTSTFAVTNTP